MKQRYVFLFVIVLLASILRFWKLGLNPASLDWDEASLGYNAYSILKTGRDEYGTFLPFSLRSFGDYKPPLYTYLSLAPTAMWGMTEFSIRFVSALFGTLTIVVCYLFCRTLFESFRAGRAKAALLATFFLAVSPWHIQFSRIAFEANVGIFFFITGVWLFILGNKRPYTYSLSFISFALSLFTYHSPRLVIPLFLMGAAVIYRQAIRHHIRWIIVSVLLFGVLILPIAYEFRSATAARFGSVTIMNPSERLGKSIQRIEDDQSRNAWIGKLTHNRRLVYGRDVLAGYLDHFNFDFLFLTGDPPGRHHAPGMGMLYFYDLFLVPIGLLILIHQRTRASWVLLWWFLVAPAASALTSGTPHAVRALLYLPTYQIFSAYGLLHLLSSFRPFGLELRVERLVRNRNIGSEPSSDSGRVRSSLAGMTVIMLVLLMCINFYYYLVMYWIHAPVEQAKEWQYGYKQAVAVAKSLEDQVEKVIVTYRYDQPYVYFLFYNQIDPAWYQQQWLGTSFANGVPGERNIERFNRNFGKYEFRNIEWEKDKELTNVLLVGTPSEISDGTEEKVTDIYYPDGSVAFRIVKR